MERKKPGATMGKDITELFGTKPHTLKLGKSFSRDPEKRTAFHSIRYDFKPASIDYSKEAEVDVGEKGEINITLPNLETKETSCTKFKGSKKPYQKECVLIFDHLTGEFSLERLSSNMQVKKQRQEAGSRAHLSNRASRHTAILDPSSAIPPSSSNKTSPNRTSTGVKKENDDAHTSSLPDIETSKQDVSPLQPSPTVPDDKEDDSSSSSSYMSSSDNDSSSSDDDNDQKKHHSDSDDAEPVRKIIKQSPSSASVRHSPMKKPQNPDKLKTGGQRKPTSAYVISQLSADLQLSESDSDEE